MHYYGDHRIWTYTDLFCSDPNTLGDADSSQKGLGRWVRLGEDQNFLPLGLEDADNLIDYVSNTPEIFGRRLMCGLLTQV